MSSMLRVFSWGYPSVLKQSKDDQKHRALTGVPAEGLTVPRPLHAVGLLVTLKQHRDSMVGRDELSDLACPGLVVEVTNVQV